jgi:alpha-tubulin suppressor-like RCC1 family protein
MPGGVTFRQINAGINHTCAVAATGQAYCWGNNGGKFGNGGTANSTTPVTAATGVTLDRITAGEAMSCGVTAANIVYCWGNNNYGQLGEGTNTSSDTPRKGIYQP